MKQKFSMSFVEAVLSTLAGFGLSVACQAYFLPMLGIEISLDANLKFACIMTAVSVARQLGMRRIFEWLHIRAPMSAAMIAVAAERRRQIEVEAHSLESDDAYPLGVLAAAGAAYAQRAGNPMPLPPACWPWDADWWNPQTVRRDLVRAGALIIAEIERFDRARKNKKQPHVMGKEI